MPPHHALVPYNPDLSQSTAPEDALLVPGLAHSRRPAGQLALMDMTARTCRASNQVSAYDLHTRLLERQMRQSQSYTAVQERCYDRIMRCAQVAPHVKACWYEVPPFILGRPPYDVQRCLSLLIRNLENNGYHVQYFFPRTLYITWDLEVMRRARALPEPRLVQAQGGRAVRGAAAAMHLQELPAHTAPELPPTQRGTLTPDRSIPAPPPAVNFQQPPQPPRGAGQAGQPAAFRPISQFRPNGRFTLSL